MSHVEVVEHLTPAVVSLAVSDLTRGSSFREGGLCAEQVERFVGLGGAWPPILVSRIDNTVIDGAHRVAAARQLGLARVDALIFDGTADEAFIEFVRRNVVQGLMLTLGERKRAAQRVLHGHPRWSDRRVAELCALSPKTVARLRDTAGVRPTEEDDQSDDGMREGRDHRLRPVRREPVRARVVEALRAQPDASLRTIASAVGVSPETVRLVRLNLANEPACDCPVETESLLVGDEGSDGTGEPDLWRTDTALASTEDGEDLLEWFARTAVDEPDLGWVEKVPLSRVYEISDEARRRAETWLQFARALENRPARVR